MNTLRFVMVLAVTSAGTALACDYPPLVAIPDGETATMDELLAAQNSVREYMTAMEAYLACVNDEREAAGEDAPADYNAIMVSRHNYAVSEMEAVAESFNEQVQAFRAANPEAEGGGMGMGMGGGGQ